MSASPSRAAVDFLGDVAARGLPYGRPLVMLIEEFGEDFVTAMRRARLLSEEPYAVDDRYPCTHRIGEGCPRRVVVGGDDELVAVCGITPPGCASVALSGDAGGHVSLRTPELARWLGPRLRLEGAAERRAGGVRLGERVLGDERLVAFLAPDPARLDPMLVDAWARAEGRCRLLVIAVHTRCVPGALINALRVRRHFTFGLDRLLDVVDGEVSASLAGVVGDLAEDLVFDASALTWPRYWLVFDPDHERAVIGAEGEALSLNGKAGAVLRRLLRERERDVSYLELYRAGWGNIAAPLAGQKLDRQYEQPVRDAVTSLRRVLAEALPADVAKRFEVVTVRATNNGMGGFRLVVPEGRVRLMGRA
ncbi:MAG: hypothetical protein Q8P18_05825 [Pseudomonadota bacterium]|nr:hypothetical protein [Pseudomonadota bacterium]